MLTRLEASPQRALPAGAARLAAVVPAWELERAGSELSFSSECTALVLLLLVLFEDCLMVGARLLAALDKFGDQVVELPIRVLGVVSVGESLVIALASRSMERGRKRLTQSPRSRTNRERQ